MTSLVAEKDLIFRLQCLVQYCCMQIICCKVPGGQVTITTTMTSQFFMTFSRGFAKGCMENPISLFSFHASFVTSILLGLRFSFVHSFPEMDFIQKLIQTENFVKKFMCKVSNKN